MQCGSVPPLKPPRVGVGFMRCCSLPTRTISGSVSEAKLTDPLSKGKQAAWQQHKMAHTAAARPAAQSVAHEHLHNMLVHVPAGVALRSCVFGKTWQAANKGNANGSMTATENTSRLQIESTPQEALPEATFQEPPAACKAECHPPTTRIAQLQLWEPGLLFKV